MKRNTLNTFISATLIMLLGVSSSAQAMVPANSRITSTSTLLVEGRLAEPLTATVTVTVGLQRSKPLIALKAGTEIQPNPSSDRGGLRGGWTKWINETTESLTYKYTITTTANGPARYLVNAEAAAENLNKKPKVRLNDKESITITLGATAVLEVVGNKITVPSDGKANNSEHREKVNGIQKNDKVSIKGSDRVYTVLAVEDLGHDDGATITLDEAPPNDLVRGDPIAEQQEFEVALSEIRLKEDTDKTQVDVTVTVSQGGAFESLDVTTAPSFAVIAPRGPEMKIWVRNLSEEEGANPDPDSEAVKTRTYGGYTYFSTHDDPHHRPGSILEYLVTIRAGNEDAIIGSDIASIPEPDDLKYVLEYVAGETRLNAGDPIPDEDIEEGVLLRDILLRDGPYLQYIDTDQTAYITYQMKVMGGDGGGEEQSNNDTYLGCPTHTDALDDLCLPDDTLWAEVVAADRQEFHTACWDQGVAKSADDGDGWVVGESKYRGDQADVRDIASTGAVGGTEGVGWRCRPGEMWVTNCAECKD